MKLLTPDQMKAIDRTATESLGIPGIVLMENAAMQIVVKASSFLKDRGDARITVVAGTGNNGGDAFAVARHLLSMGHSVSVYSMGPFEKLTGDALTNAMILKNLGLEVPILSGAPDLQRLKQSCSQSDIVIDGLFGTGLNRDVEGIFADAIDIINDFSNIVLSIDIASGVDGLTGKIRGKAVRADATVTFFLPKLGMVQYPGASCMGELTVADIGIPYALAENLITPELMEKDDISELIPVRAEDGHKGTFGTLLMVTGSRGMTGAAYLSAFAAYQTGSGLVRLAVPKSCIDSLAVLIPEAVFKPMPENEGHSCGCDDSLKELLGNADTVLAGPGLTCNDDTHELLNDLVNLCEAPMVFDADALNLFAKDKKLLENLRCEAVITPHPAEMARLMGISVKDVQENRIGTARQFADEYGLTVVLKGAGTVIAANDGRVAVNPTGNDGMATAGAGDVLAGMITSLLGQGMEPYEAAVLGAYLHGLAGDFAARKKGRSLMASDIAGNIPDALNYILTP